MSFTSLLDIEGAKSAEAMSVNEALKKLARDRSEFLVFHNTEKKGKPLTIVYLRDCGDCGVLEA